MPNKPRLSVVMASYNHAAFVGQGIDSVLGQSFFDLELVITDDGSSDATAEIISRHADSRISLERLPKNCGAPHALNRCIERARGDYIAVINSDDWFLPEKLAKQVKFLDANPDIGAVFGKPLVVDEAGVPLDAHPINALFIDNLPNRFAWLHRFFYHGNALCHPTAMVRRSVYDDVGLYNPKLRQLPDFDMWVRVCARYEIHVLPDRLTVFRVLSENGNTSAPTETNLQRHHWEFAQILHSFVELDGKSFELAFAMELPALAGLSLLPKEVQLAHLAAAVGHPVWHLVALQTMEAAFRAEMPGADLHELHHMAGWLDPFGVKSLTASEARRLALEERVAEMEKMVSELKCRGEAAEERVRDVEKEMEKEIAEITTRTEKEIAEITTRTEKEMEKEIAKIRTRTEKEMEKEKAEIGTRAEKEIAEIRTRAEHSERLATAMRLSTSWRITGPLRSVARLFWSSRRHQ